MRIPFRSAGAESGFNMTPMIDVVFLLIIFFLVSSHLAKQEAQMEIPLPHAESSDLPQTTLARIVTLNVLDDGQLFLQGKRIDVAELPSRLTAATDSSEKIEVRIRSSRSVPYRRIAPLLTACAQANVWNVTFGVVHEVRAR